MTVTVAAARLRRRRSPSPGACRCPACYDAVTALLATRAGLLASLHLSGRRRLSAVALGLPDLGYLHGTDVAALARRDRGGDRRCR